MDIRHSTLDIPKDIGHSPRIIGCTWGRLEVEGAAAPYKDAKLYPGGSREWDWNETGTRHRPGIQPADLEELLEHGASVVVLSCGMNQRLGVPRDTLSWLEERGVEARVAPTQEAVELYNELIEETRVGGLFHSTC